MGVPQYTWEPVSLTVTPELMKSSTMQVQQHIYLISSVNTDLGLLGVRICYPIPTIGEHAWRSDALLSAEKLCV